MAKRLSRTQIIGYALANLPFTMVLLSVGTRLMPLYSPSADEANAVLYVDPQTYGLVLFLIMLPAAIADPVVGYLSDRTKSRWGRRFPYILFGLPILAATYLGVWFPPVRHTSWINVAFLTVTTLLFYLSFTAVVNPYTALMPEITPDNEQRVSVSSWMAAFGTLAQPIVFVGFGLLIASYPNGLQIWGVHLADGYKVAAFGATVLLVLSTLPLLVMIKEPPFSAAKEVPMTFTQAAVATIKNPAFLTFVGPAALAGGALALMQITVRYLVKVVLHKNEDLVGWLLLGLTISTLLLYPLASFLGRHFPKKRVFSWALGSLGVGFFLFFAIAFIPQGLRIPYVWVMVLLLGFPLSLFTALQVAILADVMDKDTQLTGYQREAMYMGMQGLVQKIGWGLAPLTEGVLFRVLGNTSSHPWGIFTAPVAASILCVVALLWFQRYPLEA